MPTKYIPESSATLDKDILDCCATSNFDEEYSFIYPVSIKEDELIPLVTKYPDHSYTSVKKDIAEAFNIRGEILLGSGSEDLILRINSLIREKKYRVGIVQPIFYRITETLKSDLVYAISEEEFFKEDWDTTVDVVWLQNPNLFSSNTYTHENLRKIILKHKDILFIVDEAGMFAVAQYDTYSLLSQAHEFDNLIVLASLSKMFGLSGLRAGFASGSSKMLSLLEERGLTFPWSSLTSIFVSNVLKYIDFIEKLKTRIRKHKKEIEDLLISFNKDYFLKENETQCVFLRSQNKNMEKAFSSVGVRTLALDDYVKELGWVRLTVHSSCKIQDELMKRITKLHYEN